MTQAGTQPSEAVTAAVIGIWISEELAAMHAAGRTHGAITPARIVTEGSGGYRLSLVDPGATLEPWYTAPETIAYGAVETVCDVYALGAVLYQLVAGHTAFGTQDEDLDIVEWRVLNEQPAPLDDATLPGLAAIVARAMKREPEARYQKASELGTALRQLLADAGMSDRIGDTSRAAWQTGAAAKSDSPKEPKPHSGQRSVTKPAGVPTSGAGDEAGATAEGAGAVLDTAPATVRDLGLDIVASKPPAQITAAEPAGSRWRRKMGKHAAKTATGSTTVDPPSPAAPEPPPSPAAPAATGPQASASERPDPNASVGPLEKDDNHRPADPSDEQGPKDPVYPQHPEDPGEPESSVRGRRVPIGLGIGVPVAVLTTVTILVLESPSASTTEHKAATAHPAPVATASPTGLPPADGTAIGQQAAPSTSNASNSIPEGAPTGSPSAPTPAVIRPGTASSTRSPIPQHSTTTTPAPSTPPALPSPSRSATPSHPAVPGTINLASGCPIRASTEVMNFEGWHITDGNVNSYWEGQPGFPQTITIDLGSVHWFGRIELYLPPATVWSQRVQTIRIFGSDTNSAGTDTVLADTHDYTFDPQKGNSVLIALPASHARWLTLLFTANSHWPAAQLGELKVY